jgi:peptidoglycan-N-acetylglucosamine deacetylase
MSRLRSLFRRSNRSEAELLRRRWIRQSVLGIVTLALTPLPIVFYMTHDATGYLMYLKARYSLLPPSTPNLSSDQLAAAQADRSTPTYGVPVLVYHGIGGSTTDTADKRFTVSRTDFAWQMRSLEKAGYHAITTGQLAAYLKSGDATQLPSKPVLITFDDGREDAMLQADPILRDTGMKATMFVIGEDAEASSFYYADWGQLSSYASNGRWELENHTFGLHHYQVVGGHPLSDLVHLKPGETLTAYAERVGSDIARDTRAIDQHSPDHATAFAYPYGDWGQIAAPGVAPTLNRVLRGRFQLAFDQDGQSGWRPAMPGDDPMHIHRLEVTDMTGSQLLARLDAAQRLGRTTWEQRGLDAQITTTALAQAIARSGCQPPATLTGEPPAVPAHGKHGKKAHGKQRAPQPKKLVALTFDDGPSPYTAQILDVLHEQARSAHVTFFVHGAQLAGEQRLLERMLVAGDQIGNGTWDGSPLDHATSTAIQDSLQRTSDAIHAEVPISACYARPPLGLDRGRFAQVARAGGYGTALWSLDPADYKTTDPTLIAKRVISDVAPGGIVVLHDGGGARWPTVQALPRIITTLEARGYRLVTLSELARATSQP